MSKLRPLCKHARKRKRRSGWVWRARKREREGGRERRGRASSHCHRSDWRLWTAALGPDNERRAERLAEVQDQLALFLRRAAFELLQSASDGDRLLAA